MTDAFPVPGPDVPAPHTPEELRIAAGFSWTGLDRYPVQISLYCDTCHRVVTHDYIVTDDMSREQRWELARAHLRRFGWQCDMIGDFCPDHPEPTSDPPTTSRPSTAATVRAISQESPR